MEIINKRAHGTNDSTLGILIVDGKPFGFVIEDERREVKVKGETRIPSGKYKLGLQMAETPLTAKYRKKYPWFKHHLQLLNVPEFSSVYIHIGNYESDTEGCQVIGLNAHIYNGEFINSDSTICFKRLYEKVYPLLKAGKEITYEIFDEPDLLIIKKGGKSEANFN